MSESVFGAHAGAQNALEELAVLFRYLEAMGSLKVRGAWFCSGCKVVGRLLLLVFVIVSLSSFWFLGKQLTPRSIPFFFF